MQPGKKFWERLKSFVANVEVGDAMSEEEKQMILDTCANQINALAYKKGDLLEISAPYIREHGEGMHGIPEGTVVELTSDVFLFDNKTGNPEWKVFEGKECFLCEPITGGNERVVLSDELMRPN